MINEISEAILARLREVNGVKTVGAWTGELKDILEKTQLMPSLHALYAGAKFDQTGGQSYEIEMNWTVLCAVRNTRGRMDAATACYALVDIVRARLAGSDCGGYGILWPVAEELILAEEGFILYGLDYRLKTHIEPGEVDESTLDLFELMHVDWDLAAPDEVIDAEDDVELPQ